MPRLGLRAVTLILALVPMLRGSASAVDVSSCAQEIPPGATGTLSADLACTPGGVGVLLNQDSTLELNGHSITGGSVAVSLAGKKCAIVGPGELAGSDGGGLIAQNNIGRVKVTVRDGVVFHDLGTAAIALGEANRVKLRLDNVTIRDNPGRAVVGCNYLRIKATGLTVARNAAGLCGIGISLIGASITDNDDSGIFSWKARVRLKDSTVTGNNVSGPNYDIVTHRKPRLVNSTCDRSVQLPEVPGLATPSSPSWGVCAND
jgi:hypothetical protein